MRRCSKFSFTRLSECLGPGRDGLEEGREGVGSVREVDDEGLKNCLIVSGSCVRSQVN